MASQMEQQIYAPARLQAALTAAGGDARIEEFPSSARTAQEAADTVGTSVGQIVKSLVFLAGDAPVVALVSGVNRLDTERLAALAGATIGKADADAVRQATGYSIGGVPPIGFPAPLPTFIDRDLLQYDVVWAAAGTPRHVFPIAPKQLVRVTGGAGAGPKLAEPRIDLRREVVRFTGFAEQSVDRPIQRLQKILLSNRADQHLRIENVGRQGVVAPAVPGIQASSPAG